VEKLAQYRLTTILLRFTFGKWVWLTEGWDGSVRESGRETRGTGDMIGNPRIQGPRALRIVGNVFLLIGLVGLLTAGVLAFRESQGPRSATADGVIVDFEYGPVVEFVTQDGRKGRLSSSVRSAFFHRGDHLPVVYSPQDPTDAAIDGFAGRWFLPGLFAILGGVFAAVGLVLGVVGRFVWRG
jgi:hypothetical protein